MIKRARVESGEAMDSVDFDALEEATRARLPPGAYAFCACGADDEITARENADAWRRLRLRPRVLRGTASVDTSVTLLGIPSSMPVMLAPTGRHMLYHPEGERASAQAAAATGAAFVLATNSTVSIEDVAVQRASAPQWFQLYMSPDRSVTEGLVDRVAAAGYSAVVLTVDLPTAGYSPRAARAPIETSDAIRHVNLPGKPLAHTAYDPNAKLSFAFPVSIADLEWLVRRSVVPVIVKGVLRGDDAARCADAGAKAVIVSNHGGRHLDTTITTADALPEIVDAVGKRAEVYVDGGIRRGADILKALALGARAVLIGRPMLWGLTMDGADGVRAVLEHLNAELSRAMILSGAASLAEIGPDLIVGASSPAR
jgi:4-hydroxymandelate oxidase